MIARHGVARLRDDHGDKPRRATRIGRKQVHGVISRPSDVDAFTFRTTCRGKVRVKARNAEQGPNLDIRLAVKAPGRRARVVDPLSAAHGRATGLDATWRGRARGRWVVKVRGTGARNPATTGYSRYGSLGAYTLKVRGPCVKR